MDYGSIVLTSSNTGISPISKQSCYEGSSRQIRGAVIRALTTLDEVELEELKTQLDCDVKDSELEPIMEKLVSEGLVEMRSSNRYRIAE